MVADGTIDIDLVDFPDPVKNDGVTSSSAAAGEEPSQSEESASSKRSRPVGDRTLGWIGSVITVLGAVLALFAAYLFLFTPFEASRSQHALLSELQGKAGAVVLTGHVPAEGHAVAVINIPLFGLSQVVVEGTSALDLTKGPGLMPGSALPGTPGNTVIAGRRYLFGKPFAHLGNLVKGDHVQIVSAYGKFTYDVTNTYEVTPGSPDPIAPTEQNRLTLLTANASLAPSAREVAVAKLVTPPVVIHVSSLGLPPRSERALSGDSGSLLPAVIWGILFLAGVVLTVRMYRRWRRPWPTYIMTTPVLIALAILFFQELSHLLPATL